ncbi:hypothetical protein BGX26_001918 [Mortierella sp. AD094]|nr:hypothetical protein BGX26_001918 [Mortierella sp. AD094]
MKQYVWKPYKEPENKPEKPKSKLKPKPVPKSLSDSTAKTDKLEIARMMAYQHPTTCLFIGNLSANVKHALPGQEGLQHEAMSVYQEAASEAARIKRKGQRLIGTKDVKNDADDATEDDEDEDEAVGVVEEDDDEEEDGDKDDSDLGGPGRDGNAHRSFLLSFLSHLYSGNIPTKPEVAKFIDRLKGFHLYNPPRTKAEINQSMPFTPKDLLKKRIDKGQLEKSNAEIQIRGDLSAIENYVMLNKLSPNPRKIVPMTSSKQPYVGFTERELAGFFFKSGGTLKEAHSAEMGRRERAGLLDQAVCRRYRSSKLEGRQKRKTGRRAKIKLWSLDTLKRHLQKLEEPGFVPGNYAENGYISRGMVLTDGFGLYLLAFKLKELQSVRFRRLPDDRLPLRIASTVGGTDYYLQEIRNVIRAKEDIKELWPKANNPCDIKILTLDAGQAFVVGAYAYLPGDPDAHYNLAVNQKLSESIAHAESNLPPLRGPGASVVEYVKKLEEVEEQLSEFCGSLGKKLNPTNPVLIGVGLGQFKSTGRLSSLHSTFLDYFIPLAQSLGYIVVGLNEYYTSKKCPDCQNFVAQVTLRELYCPDCERYHRRDVMAAENMSRIVRGYLAEQKRPRYLQPKTADGRYPWASKAEYLCGSLV